MGAAKKEAAAARKEALSAKVEPEEEEEGPALDAGALRQLIMLPVIWGSGKLNLDNPQNLLILQTVFASVILTGFCLIQLAIYKAVRKSDGTRVKEPGTSNYITDADKAEDGSVSAKVYDVAKLKETKLQFMISAGIGAFVHMKWGYTQPLLMMSALHAGYSAHHNPAGPLCHACPLTRLLMPSSGLMQPLQLYDNNAMHIYLRGVAAVPRPWKAAKSGNPLQEWAEKKKQEAEDAKNKQE